MRPRTCATTSACRPPTWGREAMLIIAAVGAKAFYLLMIWLASAIGARELSKRKGYGEKVGLGTGLLLSFVGLIVWLVIPAKPESSWKTRRARQQAAAELAEDREPLRFLDRGRRRSLRLGCRRALRASGSVVGWVASGTSRAAVGAMVVL